jgi:hypothetical protein
MAGSRLPRFREALRNLALVVGSVSIAVLLLEAAVRLFTDVPPVIRERDPVVGSRYRPHFRGRVFVEESGREVLLAFNRDGFRGRDVPYERTTDGRRVAVLGDSLVAAIACDEADTAVGHLERLLNSSSPGHRWEVLNFGVSGSSTGQELVLFREVVARYRPDIVIVAYFVGNDFSDNSTRLSSNPRIYFEIDRDGNLVQRPLSAARSALSAWLNAHSRLYVWQKTANDVLRERDDDGYRIFRSDPPPELDEVWELNERLIVALRDEVEAAGSRFVLALYPSGAQVYGDVWEALLDQAGDPPGTFDPTYPERRLTALGQRAAFPVVTMREPFLRAAGGAEARETRAGDLLFFGGNGHLSERGNTLAAQILYRFLTTTAPGQPSR